MEYRIIKRSFSDGRFYFLVQSRWWILPWKDDEGYSTNQYYFNTLEQSQKRLNEIKVYHLKDEIITNC